MNESLKNFLTNYEENHYLQGDLLIWEKGNIIHEKSYGLANVELQVAHDSRKKFKIASLTKAFTAMLIFILQEKKLLSIDDSVQKYFPQLEKYQDVTLYHCLTCSSGIPDYFSLDSFWEKEMRMPHTLDDIIKQMYQEPLNFPAGTAYEYSSTGYLILTKVIEQVTGLSYAEALEKFILTPLEMQDTACMNNIDLVEKLVESYGFWAGDIQAPKTDMSFPTGAAGIVATAEDLLKWAQAIIERKLISKKSYQIFETVNHDTYACGWDVTEINGQNFLQHRGDLDGFVTSIKICREAEIVIIFLVNQEIIPATDITLRVAKYLLGSHFKSEPLKKTALSHGSMQNYLGKYRYVDQTDFQEKIVTIAEEAGELYFYCQKRYDIPYKFCLQSYVDKNEQLVLRTERIAESIYFLKNGKVMYTMLDDAKYELEKVLD